MPDVHAEDLYESYAGIQAQLVSEDGELVKDPLFVEREDAVHILNAVSPGLTFSLPFGEHIAGKVAAKHDG